MFPLRQYGRCLLTSLVILWLVSVSGGQQSRQLDARETVQRLLTMNLTERTLDQETRDVLVDIRKKPAVYREPIADALALPDQLDQVGEYVVFLRLANAVGLAYRIGVDHGRELIHTFLDETSNAIEEELGLTDCAEGMPVSAHLTNLRRLRNAALEALGQWEDAYAVDMGLEVIEDADVATQYSMLDYFANVGAGHARLKEALRGMIKEGRTDLSRLPYTKRVLDAITAVPATRPRRETSSSAPCQERRPAARPGKDTETGSVQNGR